jgi:hypothetical protein
MTANLKIECHPELFNMSISEWASVEYIASRNIDPEEELLIDYGVEWRHAWNSHLANWKPLKRMVDKLSAANQLYQPKTNGFGQFVK